jgi:hypothetical protein
VETVMPTEDCEGSITAEYRLQSYTKKRAGKGAPREKFCG